MRRRGQLDPVTGWENDMANESDKMAAGEAFPFETDNPSGVPGVTEIHGQVIAAIAGHVADQVEGVVSIGRSGLVRSMADAFGSDAASKAAGVDVEAGKKEAILDFDLTVLYGHNIPGVIQRVRETVATELIEQVGLTAKEINVVVSAIEFPDHSDSARVQ